MTALDLLVRWSGHHYFIAYWYTLFPVEIKHCVDSCVQMTFALATTAVSACTPRYCLEGDEKQNLVANKEMFNILTIWIMLNYIFKKFCPYRAVNKHRLC